MRGGRVAKVYYKSSKFLRKPSRFVSIIAKGKGETKEEGVRWCFVEAMLVAAVRREVRAAATFRASSSVL
jgi:hypothetical protein